MNNRRLLYLEDDAVLATVTCKALVRRGFELEHFASLGAVNTCAYRGHFDFALLDLKLEDGISLQLIEELLAINSDMRIVVLTGYASIATAVQAVKSGAVNYLAKPATADDIVRAFGELAEESEQPIGVALDEMSLRRREWETIQAALTANHGNISATARQLKMHRRTLQRKLQKKPVSE